jgi:tRNA 2-thiouridine synthesizing protein A
MEQINCLGMRCPLPIIAVAKELNHMPAGDSVILLADDPATLPDLRAWARMTGNDIYPESETKFRVTRRIQNVQGDH